VNDLEKQTYCRDITWAAKSLGYGLQRVRSADGIRFIWHDALTKQQIACPVSRDEKEALFLACEKLADAINIKPNGGK
jgi:hypothetical protein